MLLTWNKTLSANHYFAEWKHFRLVTWTHREGGKWPGEIAVLSEHGIVSHIVYEHLVYPTSLEESQNILETELYNYLTNEHQKASKLVGEFESLTKDIFK